jgi:hypothetical protein
VPPYSFPSPTSCLRAGSMDPMQAREWEEAAQQLCAALLSGSNTMPLHLLPGVAHVSLVIPQGSSGLAAVCNMAVHHGQTHEPAFLCSTTDTWALGLSAPTYCSTNDLSAGSRQRDLSLPMRQGCAYFFGCPVSSGSLAVPAAKARRDMGASTHLAVLTVGFSNQKHMNKRWVIVCTEPGVDAVLLL